MRRFFRTLVTWEILFCLLGVGVCLIPTVPRTRAFWGAYRTWTSLQPDRVHLDTVLPGSPAAAAGLRPGGWVLAVNGQPAHFTTFDGQIKRMQPGSDLPLRVQRNGQEVLLQGVGAEPQVEAIYYYDIQLVCLLVGGALAVLLIATQPLQPTPLWRAITVSVLNHRA